MILGFTVFFSLYLLYFIVCFFLGRGVNKLLFSTNKFTSLQHIFLSVLFGDAVIVSAYAIYKSNFLTIHVLAILLIIITALVNKIILRKKPHKEYDKLKDGSTLKNTFLLLPLIIILPFVIRAIVYFNYKYYLPNIPQWDYQYYLTLSETFNQNGFENFFGGRSLLFDAYHAVTPYRYHDIWLASMFQEIYSLSSIGVYNLIVSSFTNLLALLGLLSVFEFYKKVSAVTVLWSVLFLFTGFAYYYVGDIYVDTNTPIEYQKLGMTYALMAAAIIFYKIGFPLQAILAICILFVYGVTGLPMVIGLGPLIGILFFKAANKSYALFALLPIIAIIYFVLFYHLFGYKDIGITITLPGIKVFAWSVKNLLIKTFVRYWYLYLWIIVALLVNREIFVKTQKDKKLYLLTLFFLFFCILFQAVMVNLGDPTQFATCNNSPLLHIILYIFVAYILIHISTQKWVNKAIVGLFIVYLLYSPYASYSSNVGIYNESKKLTKYSKEYLYQVMAVAKNIQNKKGLYWVDSSYFSNVNRMKEFFIRPGDYLKVIGNNFDMFCLSADLMPDGPDANMHYTKTHSAIMVFANMHKDLSLTDAKIKFIKDYHFEYLLLVKNVVLPRSIDTLISKRITDPESGNTFCLLKY